MIEFSVKFIANLNLKSQPTVKSSLHSKFANLLHLQ